MEKIKSYLDLGKENQYWEATQKLNSGLQKGNFNQLEGNI